jgi:hypothetical protein
VCAGADLCVGNPNLHLERRQLEVLLVFLRAAVTSGQGEDLRVTTLQFAESMQGAFVVRQGVVGKATTWDDVRSQAMTPFDDPPRDEVCSAEVLLGDEVVGHCPCVNMVVFDASD